MSGHSKWSTIKRKKEITDKARAVVFSKLSRIITLAVQEGGGIADPNGNIKLRIAVERARAANMPKNNIERAIEKATRSDTNALKEMVYEGFAGNGVSLLISATTDNPNRTFSVVKNTLEKLGGKLGSEHSARYKFVKCGVVEFNKQKVTDEDVFAFADRIGALDIEDHDSYFVFIPFEKVGYVADFLKGIETEGTDVIYRPITTITVPPESSQKIEELINAMEELDEVDAVYSDYGV